MDYFVVLTAFWIASWVGCIRRAREQNYDVALYGVCGLLLGPGGYLLTMVATRQPRPPQAMQERLEAMALVGDVGSPSRIMSRLLPDLQAVVGAPEVLPRVEESRVSPLLAKLEEYFDRRRLLDLSLDRYIVNLLAGGCVVLYGGLAFCQWLLPAFLSFFSGVPGPLPLLTKELFALWGLTQMPGFQEMILIFVTVLPAVLYLALEIRGGLIASCQRAHFCTALRCMAAAGLPLPQALLGASRLSRAENTLTPVTERLLATAWHDSATVETTLETLSSCYFTQARGHLAATDLNTKLSFVSVYFVTTAVVVAGLITPLTHHL